MLCPECGRPTMIKYSVHNDAETTRMRECSQGHQVLTIEISKKAYTSLGKVRRLLESGQGSGMDIKMAIANLIGDL